jgi:hypothetical protein
MVMMLQELRLPREWKTRGIGTDEKIEARTACDGPEYKLVVRRCPDTQIAVSGYSCDASSCHSAPTVVLVASVRSVPLV